MLVIVMFVQNVNTVHQSEATGPTVEFQFKHGFNSSVNVGYKKLKTKEWNVTISPEHYKVTLISPQKPNLMLFLGNKSCC